MVKNFFVITPCRNAERYIADTIESVLSQSALKSGRAKLELLIIDGASTDRTLEIVRSFASPAIKLISEKDRGMYDAIAKGLRQIKSPGICSYINAGDIYSKWAFDVVLDVFDRKQVRWLTGINTIYNDKLQVVKSTLPFRYRHALFSCGAYGKHLSHVQQESTFWDSSLNNSIDLDRLSIFKLAGDFYLWHEFSKTEQLSIVESHLGGFRVHPGQMSEQMNRYRSEVASITRSPNLFDIALMFWDKFIWYAPPRVKKFLNSSHLLQYNHQINDWG